VRILGLLGTLLEGGRPSVHQLAARFHTRRETIYRDLRALEAAGYPVVGDEMGRLSRPRLLPEARRNLPHLRFTDSEIAALLWAAKQSGHSSPFRDVLPSTIAKLRALADGGNAIASEIEAVVGECDWGAKDYAPHQGTVLRLVEAIVRRRRCRVEYRSPTSPSAKKYQYDPYRLLTVAGGVYCVGKVPPYENFTTLAVERIQALDLTDDQFIVDARFDADRYRREAFGVVWEKPMTVTVRFRAGQAPYVRERIWHPTQRIRELRDGRIDLTFRAGGTFEITRWVLGWGDAVEVISPGELRDHVRDTLICAARAYAPCS